MSWKGWEGFVPSGPQTPAQRTAAKRHKFNAQPHYVGRGGIPLPVQHDVPDGAVVFPSKREAERFVVLANELSSKAITGLQLQPQFALHVVKPDGVKVCIGRYIADFAYERAGVKVIEDSKGMKTALYLWKKSHVEAEYAVRVVEV